MKIGIVTVHSAVSYGAMLQAYALQTYLVKVGVDVDIIDYRNQIIENKNKTIPRRLNFSFSRFLKDVVTAPSRYHRRRRFIRFMHQYMNLSDRYFTIDDLRINGSSKYDAFIVGSDQVWNPSHANFDPVYFLAFAPNKKKNSYAASFGFREIPHSMIGEYKERLKEFSCLSIRELSGVTIAKKLLGRTDIVGSIDPSLLLDRSHWIQLVRQQKRIVSERYILVFEVNGARHQNYASAIKIAKKNNLKIVCISPAIHSLIDLKAHQSGPLEFLNYLSNADYILTDSFHGVAFSIIFHKPFTFSTEGLSSDTCLRMEELLGMLNLLDRKNANEYTQEIDWDGVDSIIRAEQVSARKYLHNIIKKGD